MEISRRKKRTEIVFGFFSGGVPEKPAWNILQHFNRALTVVLCNSPQSVIIEFWLLVELMPP